MGYINSDGQYEEPDFWQPKKPPKVNIGAIIAAISLILMLGLIYLGIDAISKMAHAHVAGHPEWNEVLGASTNQQGTSCCGLGDVHLLDFDEWRGDSARGYEVLIQGEWHKVPPWKLTQNEPNPTAHALVWYGSIEGTEHGSHYRNIAVYCFRPLESY